MRFHCLDELRPMDPAINPDATELPGNFVDEDCNGDLGGCDFSIVIPCFNEEEMIAANFEHILQQTEPPDEVILADNNSTDRSRSIAASFAERFRLQNINLKIVNVPEKPIVPGALNTRTAAFDIARGDLIGTIDADTLIDIDWVEQAKNIFTCNDEGLVAIGGPVFYDNVGFWLKSYLTFVFFCYWANNWFFIFWRWSWGG